MVPRINLPNGYLSPVVNADSAFIHTLFADKDVKKYYVLRADHAANLDAFVQYMIACMERHSALDYIIYNSSNQKVGLITAELIQDHQNGEIMWNIGYAVAPQFRKKGYATSALNRLTDYLLNNFSIAKVSLDICIDNRASEHVAVKCGYMKPAARQIAYFDMEHPEQDIRFKWYKSAAGKRAELFNQAANSFRAKDYPTAIRYYQQALSEVYQEGSPYTDAQIYSNMGMAYSSMRQYQEAFRYLKKAQAMGLNNASIERELLWLKTHVGLC